MTTRTSTDVEFLRALHSALCLSHIQPQAPCEFYHPYDFLPVRPSEAPVGILRRAPYGLTRLHTYGLVEFAGLHGYPVRCPYGHRTGPARESSKIFISYGARAWPARVPYGALTDTQGNWHNHNWQKSRTGVVFGRTGPVRAPHGHRTGCSQAVHNFKTRTGPVSL